MIKKLSGSIDNRQSEETADRAYLERLLAEIALDIPPVEYLSYPSQPSRGGNRSNYRDERGNVFVGSMNCI